MSQLTEAKKYLKYHDKEIARHQEMRGIYEGLVANLEKASSQFHTNGNGKSKSNGESAPAKTGKRAKLPEVMYRVMSRAANKDGGKLKDQTEWVWNTGHRVGKGKGKGKGKKGRKLLYQCIYQHLRAMIEKKHAKKDAKTKFYSLTAVGLKHAETLKKSA